MRGRNSSKAKYTSVAQLEVQHPSKVKVVGSSPIGGTITKEDSGGKGRRTG